MRQKLFGVGPLDLANDNEFPLINETIAAVRPLINETMAKSYEKNP